MFSGLVHSCLVCLGEKKEEADSYVTLTIDTEHKVRDHYNVHEQLGV